MIHLGIDPSVSCTGLARLDHRMYAGVAIVQAKSVVHACLEAVHAVENLAHRAYMKLRDELREVDLELDPRAHAWIEFPRDYGKNRKADPNDLVAIAAVSGAYASAIDRTCPMDVSMLHVSDWKGQVPKKVMQNRIIAALTQFERAALSKDMVKIPRGLQNNAYDALGIVLKGVGRL